MQDNTPSSSRDKLPMPLFGAGLAALYLGERALQDTPRLALDALAGILLLAGFALALGRWTGAAKPERKRAYGWLMQAYTVALLGVGVYGLQSPEWALISDAKLHTCLQVAWPALVLLGVLPMVAMELAVGSMERTPTLEIWRVRLAARAAWIVGLALVAFAGVNFTAATWNRKIDLSYFKTTRVGTSTQSIINNLTAPVAFSLFFPPGNEVLEQTRAYVDELAHDNKQVSVEIVDQAMNPERAQTLKVRSNGYLVIQGNNRSETIRIDPDAEEARDVLRNLDVEVQKRLLRVIRPGRVAYLTSGHAERDYAPTGDDKRAGLGDLKMFLESQGFAVRRLGLGEGLGSDIPKDASLVLVVGAQEPFTPAERDAMHRYLQRGGRALFAIDPDHGAPDNALLAPLGVKVGTALVANDKYLVRVEGHGESPYYLATNRSAPHPVVNTLESSAQRFWVGIFGGANVSRLEAPPADLNITFALHAMPNSWEDKNGNGKFDPPAEVRSNFEFVAAIEKIAKAPDKPNAGGKAENANGLVADANAKAAKANTQVADANGKAADANALANLAKAAEPPPAMRVVVVGDADFISNGVLRNAGNAYFVTDAVRWLAGDEQSTAGIVESEKDVPIEHRKDRDALWFYGTSFVIPVAVLMGGLSFTRRTRRPRSKR